MMMLTATRDPAWEELPMPGVIDTVASSMRGAAGDAREESLQAFERAVGICRHVYARERVGLSHVVTLTGMEAGGAARMPVRRVTWSLAFTDEAVRDDLFAWLATRIDRWDDWGALAFGNGADVLTGHLLTLIVASHAPGAVS